MVRKYKRGDKVIVPFYLIEDGKAVRQKLRFTVKEYKKGDDFIEMYPRLDIPFNIFQVESVVPDNG